MLISPTPQDYLLCLHCGFAGWTGCWLQCCPECQSPVPGSDPGHAPFPAPSARAAAARPAASLIRDTRHGRARARR